MQEEAGGSESEHATLLVLKMEEEAMSQGTQADLETEEAEDSSALEPP